MIFGKNTVFASHKASSLRSQKRIRWDSKKSAKIVKNTLIWDEKLGLQAQGVFRGHLRSARNPRVRKRNNKF